VSHKPSGALDEFNGRLTDKQRAALIRIACKLAAGYEGEINLTVGQGGSIRFIEWVQREDGATLRENLG